jgi:post-segregation antitoxin (ccd killing protein)
MLGQRRANMGAGNLGGREAAMANNDAKLKKLLDELDAAKVEVERLFKEAIAKDDKALHQRFWDATEREALARRSVLKHTGG